MQVSIANKRPILTTEFVVVELANLFSRVADRATFIEFVRYIWAHPNTTIIPVSSELVHRGFELFTKRPDKEWSLTDCISFVVMEEQRIAEALSSDGHFVQAGFTMLL
jgi:uncharacterized protein